METVLHCDCGFEVRADSEAQLVAQVQYHALEAHGMKLSKEEVLQLASRAPSTNSPTSKGRTT